MKAALIVLILMVSAPSFGASSLPVSQPGWRLTALGDAYKALCDALGGVYGPDKVATNPLSSGWSCVGGTWPVKQ